MSGKLARVELRIYGKVQGVFYRANTRETAQKLGLEGWVENLADGTVKAVAEGSRSALESIVEWAHQGSPSARVDNVEVQWGEATGECSGFQVRR